MARTPGSSDGSAPAVGELVTDASGSRPRTPRRGTQAATIATSGDRDSGIRGGFDEHQAAVRAAVAAHNSGTASMGGGVNDPEGLLSGSGGGSGGTWADPSSLTR